jgi:hypothetical protein
MTPGAVSGASRTASRPFAPGPAPAGLGATAAAIGSLLSSHPAHADAQRARPSHPAQQVRQLHAPCDSSPEPRSADDSLAERRAQLLLLLDELLLARELAERLRGVLSASGGGETSTR